jgi:hypothetical protein
MIIIVAMSKRVYLTTTWRVGIWRDIGIVVRGKLGRKRVREHRPSAIDRGAFATERNQGGSGESGEGEESFCNVHIDQMFIWSKLSVELFERKQEDGESKGREAWMCEKDWKLTIIGTSV